MDVLSAFDGFSDVSNSPSLASHIFSAVRNKSAATGMSIN